MHPAAERLKEKYGHILDVGRVWETGPSQRKIFSINSEFFRAEFLQPIFEKLIGELECSAESEMDVESVVVDNIPTIKYENKMHVCRRCLKNGLSEKEARNVQTKYSFTRSLDEAGKEAMRCLNCGNTWNR
jgi:hypothetical protein